MKDWEVLLRTDHEIATEVVFEDKEVRVCNQIVKKRVDIPKHEHKLDYFLLNLSGEGPNQVQFHDGTGEPIGETFEFFRKPGPSGFIKKDHIETAHNAGSDYHAILVELKKH